MVGDDWMGAFFPLSSPFSSLAGLRTAAVSDGNVLNVAPSSVRRV